MTEETSNVIPFADHRAQPSNVSQHSKRAAAEHKRWLEIWHEAWVDEGARRGKSLPAKERRALASHIQRMAAEIKIMHGSRSGKIAAVLAGAIQMTKDEARARGCPQKVIDASTAVREYRIERFTNSDPKLLRGKLLDWLRVTELLAELLNRNPKREIILLYDESRMDFARCERSSPPYS